MRKIRLQSRSSRRGNFALLLIFTVPVLVGVAAVTVDLSYQKVVRSELQATADIAVAAGVEQLDQTGEGVAAAREAAIRAALRNHSDNRPVVLEAGDIEFGTWNHDTWDFEPETDAEFIDAMRITLRMDDVSTTFANMAFGDAEVGATARSTAMAPPGAPAGGTDCYIPLAVASCLFDHYTEAELNNTTFVLNPAGVDNVGWARIGDSPNASFLKDQIGNCRADGDAVVGDSIGLQNGVVSSALNELVSAINSSSTSWDTEAWGPIPAPYSKSAISSYGKTLEGNILVFDGGDEYCTTGGSFNGTETLVGFSHAVVYDVRTSGGSADKNIKVKLDSITERPVGNRRGGYVDGGVTYKIPVKLVQ